MKLTAADFNNDCIATTTVWGVSVEIYIDQWPLTDDIMLGVNKKLVFIENNREMLMRHVGDMLEGFDPEGKYLNDNDICKNVYLIQIDITPKSELIGEDYWTSLKFQYHEEFRKVVMQNYDEDLGAEALDTWFTPSFDVVVYGDDNTVFV